MTETGYESYGEQGTGAHFLQAAKDTPVVGDVVDGVEDVAKGDITAVAGDVLSFASDAGSVLSDPLNALISAGLGFLMDVITPLRDELQKVTGDPDALDSGKEAFDELSKDIGKLADELEQITQSGFQNWSGDGKDAAAKRVQTFVKGVRGTANNAANVAQLLEISGTLMEAAYDLVMSIIADVIEWLIVTWVAALAAEIPTFGASTAAAGAATTGEVAVGSANAAEKVEQTTSLIGRITNIIRKIMSELKKLKDAEKVLREGKSLKGVKDVKSAGKAADEAKKAEKAAKATKDTGLLGKAKDWGTGKAKEFVDKKTKFMKEDLDSLVHNPQGRLQEMAHSRNLKDDIKETLTDAGTDVLKDAKDPAKDFVTGETERWYEKVRDGDYRSIDEQLEG